MRRPAKPNDESSRLPRPSEAAQGWGTSRQQKLFELEKLREAQVMMSEAIARVERQLGLGSSGPG